ncbi:Riboflavin synthase [Gracilaria domingensis]|nr:Riboflavin synthase [Gracilaria domingensis]
MSKAVDAAFVSAGFCPRVQRAKRTCICGPETSEFLAARPVTRASVVYDGRISQSNTKMVFTGIVEEMGTVQLIENLESEEGGVNMSVEADKTLDGVKLGDSISVNGTCLTVTQLQGQCFTFGLAPETLRRTNLGELETGNKVNLERSVSAEGRFGGHVVQGHVDCTGTITKIKREKDAIWFTIKIESEYMKYVVEKGYVAVDGTSLTVCDVLDEQSSFTFMMIPYTQAHVVQALKEVGNKVNIEVDITGKYIERILSVKGMS